jgi:hypothetical protein
MIDLNPHSPDDALICATCTPIQILASAPYLGSSEAIMAHPAGESIGQAQPLRDDFDFA